MVSLWIQALAFPSFFLFIFSFWLRKRKEILFAQLVGLLFFALHFSLLGAWSGVGIALTHSIMLVLFIGRDKYLILKNNAVLYFFLGAYTFIYLITPEGFYGVFSFVSAMFASAAKWEEKTSSIRVWSIVSGIFWGLYCFFAGSPGGVIVECLIVSSIILSLIFKR